MADRVGANAQELPEGTVTVLFAHVEGSTDVTNRLGDAPARDLLRQLVFGTYAGSWGPSAVEWQ
jgi:class 3 adenylate cyclase